MNKLTAIIVGYIIMASITNSYTRNYRWDDWSDYRDVATTGLCVTFCTIFWPLYWTSRLTDVVVDVMMHTKVDVSKPEIME